MCAREQIIKTTGFFKNPVVLIICSCNPESLKPEYLKYYVISATSWPFSVLRILKNLVLFWFGLMAPEGAISSGAFHGRPVTR
jgi:hypothetical protein